MPSHRITFFIVALIGCDPQKGGLECEVEAGRALAEPTAQTATLVSGNTQLAIDLHQALATGDDNLFFSPFSISAALGMTSAGAAGDTLSQMQAVLQMDLEGEAWHEQLGMVTRDLSREDECLQFELDIANRLFAGEGIELGQSFLDITTEHYDANVEQIDFADADAAASRVNGWVSDQTQGMIPEIVTPDMLSTTVMLLANAIYFKGDWVTAFDKGETRDEPFTLLSGETVQVPMMHLGEGVEVEGVRIGGDEHASVLELPYMGDEIAMLVVVPAEPGGLPDIEAALTVAQIDGWVDSLASSSEVYFSIPKFELESSLSLNETLIDLGMVDAFDGGLADFSAMAPDGGLFVGWVVHKARIIVDEEGTEAAAATVVSMDESAPPSVVADRPFLFLLRDKVTGSILFMGRVTDPR